MKNRSKISICFSSVGRRVSLINCFKNAAHTLGIELETVAVDVSPEWSPASQVADFAFKVPPCKDANFLDSILKICDEKSIDIIIPTIDTELMFYSENRDLFKKKGVFVVVGSKDFIEFAYDKKKTISFLNKMKIPTPKTWNINEDIKYPGILKPRFGSNSKGIEIINSFEDLKIKKLDAEKYLMQEICKGSEFTINTFFDCGLKSSIPCYRKFVRDGEVCFAETIYIEQFQKIAEKIANFFPNVYTPFCFQGFLDKNGEVKIFEVNSRFCGGYPLCDKAGGEFAKWILQKALGVTPDYSNEWKKNLRMLRYDQEIFL